MGNMWDNRLLYILRNDANRLWRQLSFALIAVLGLAFSAIGQEKHPFVFCYENTELYPNFVGNSSDVPDILPGVSIDLMKMIGNRVDLSMQFVRFPWKRCLSLLETGRASGVIASYSESRLAFGRYPMQNGAPDESKRISTAGYYLYQLNDKAPVWNGTDFIADGLTIGAPLGYSIVEVLRGRGLKVMEAGNADGLLTMLRRSRVDAVAAPGLATDSLLRRDPSRFKGIERLEHPLQVKAYYLMLSRQFVEADPVKAASIWAAVGELRDSATGLLLEQY